MKKFTRWISAKLINNHLRINDLKVRAQYGALEGWVSIFINVVLFIIKILIGLSIKSISLIADAIHTLTDCVTSVIVIIGFKMAQKPSDREHPYGHGKMESIAALTVSILLFVAGVELLEQSIHSIIHPQTSTVSLILILIISGTIILKELLSRFSYELGDIIDSKALKADALHHRSDAFTTVLVIVALIASRFGYNSIDGIMGILVSLVIFYSAFLIAKDAINPLLGEAPSKESIKEIEGITKKIKGVLGVHDIIYNKYGVNSIICLHIEVSDKESASKLHELSEIVEEEIVREMGGTAIVHIDPINKDHPKYSIISKTIKEIISNDRRIHSFHDLRIIGSRENKCNVVFDIALMEDADVLETYDIIGSVREQFNDKFPEMKTVIKAEPKFAYNI